MILMNYIKILVSIRFNHIGKLRLLLKFQIIERSATWNICIKYTKNIKRIELQNGWVNVAETPKANS